MDTIVDKQLLVRFKLLQLQRALEEIIKLIHEANDPDHTAELLIISQVALELENVRLYKLMYSENTA